MAWRPHKAEQSPNLISFHGVEAIPVHDTPMPAANPIDGPLQWRDRITEIDTTVVALEDERAGLIQRLADEGLALLRVDSKPIKAEDSAQGEDMSDPWNWKKGDIVEATEACYGQFSIGSQYVLRHDYNPQEGHAMVEEDDRGSTSNGWSPERFKWHSRP